MFRAAKVGKVFRRGVGAAFGGRDKEDGGGDGDVEAVGGGRGFAFDVERDWRKSGGRRLRHYDDVWRAECG